VDRLEDLPRRTQVAFVFGRFPVFVPYNAFILSLKISYNPCEILSCLVDLDVDGLKCFKPRDKYTHRFERLLRAIFVVASTGQRHKSILVF
jgi:hypothetical protein